MINLGGTKKTVDVKFGNRQVKSIYLGNGLVWKPSKIYDCEIDYLESNGNSFFIKDFGETLLFNKRAFEIGFWVTNSVHQMRIVGNSNLYINESGYLAHYTPAWTSTNITPKGPYNTVYIDNVSGNRIINDVNSTFNPNFTETDGTTNIYIFSQEDNPSRTVEGRLYYFKFWYDGQLIYDCIPVRKGNVGYLYDKVHDELWENAGTEPWGLGKDIIPFEQFTQYDYIENTTDGIFDYIDLQYFPNTDTDIIINYQMYDYADVETNTNYIGLFGTRGTSYNNTAYSYAPYCFNTSNTDRIVRANNVNYFGDSNKYKKAFLYRNYRHFFLYHNTDDADYYRQYYVAQASTSFKTVRSLFVFGENGNDTASKSFLRTFLGKIYNIKIQEGNTLIKDLVPVKHKDGTVGFYDKVTNKFHYGNNPTTFTVGNEFVRDTYDAEIEYIETDGLAYIDTKVALCNNLNFDIDMSIPPKWDGDYGIWYFGGRTSGTANQLGLFCYPKVNETYWRFSNNSVTIKTSYVDGRYNFKNTYASYPTYNKLNINNEEVATGSTTAFSTDLNFYLFTLNNNGKAVIGNIISGTKLYSCKLYENEILIRDFIPVRKNGIGYLYDKVSGKLFGNANTKGNFILGNDIQ